MTIFYGTEKEIRGRLMPMMFALNMLRLRAKDSVTTLVMCDVTVGIMEFRS